MKEKIMRTCLNNGRHEAGFTVIELMAAVAIFAILASIAIPVFSVWRPNYKLKSAARDLYSNLQMAKLGAVKQNKEWAVVFVQGSDQYYVCSDDDDPVGDSWDSCPDKFKEKIVNLGDYKYAYFGHASIYPNPGVDGVDFEDGKEIYYAGNNYVTFSPRGTSKKGYVYIQNSKETVYGIGTRAGGVIHLRKWKGSEWD